MTNRGIKDGDGGDGGGSGDGVITSVMTEESHVIVGVHMKKGLFIDFAKLNGIGGGTLIGGFMLTLLGSRLLGPRITRFSGREN